MEECCNIEKLWCCFRVPVLGKALERRAKRWKHEHALWVMDISIALCGCIFCVPLVILIYTVLLAIVKWDALQPSSMSSVSHYSDDGSEFQPDPGCTVSIPQPWQLKFAFDILKSVVQNIFICPVNDFKYRFEVKKYEVVKMVSLLVFQILTVLLSWLTTFNRAYHQDAQGRYMYACCGYMVVGGPWLFNACLLWLSVGSMQAQKGYIELDKLDVEKKIADKEKGDRVQVQLSGSGLSSPLIQKDHSKVCLGITDNVDKLTFQILWGKRLATLATGLVVFCGVPFFFSHLMASSVKFWRFSALAIGVLLVGCLATVVLSLAASGVFISEEQGDVIGMRTGFVPMVSVACMLPEIYYLCVEYTYSGITQDEALATVIWERSSAHYFMNFKDSVVSSVQALTSLWHQLFT